MIPHSLQLAPKESKARGNKPINVTSHLCLRLNEFIRPFLGKVFLGERIRHVVSKTKGHRVPNQGSKMVGNTAQAADAAHGQLLSSLA